MFRHRRSNVSLGSVGDRYGFITTITWPQYLYVVSSTRVSHLQYIICVHEFRHHALHVNRPQIPKITQSCRLDYNPPTPKLFWPTFTTKGGCCHPNWMLVFPTFPWVGSKKTDPWTTLAYTPAMKRPTARHFCPSLWPSGNGAHFGRKGSEFDSWQCRIYIISHVHRTYDYFGSFWVLWVHMTWYKNFIENNMVVPPYWTSTSETWLSVWLVFIININTSATDCHASITLHTGAVMLCRRPFH